MGNPETMKLIENWKQCNLIGQIMLESTEWSKKMYPLLMK